MGRQDVEARRVEILLAAVPVFLRYGFKKTSMDELARAAGLSRPGLYLHFDSKEALFCEGIGLLIDRSLDEARQAFADAERPLVERVVAAFSAVHGPQQWPGMGGEAFAELLVTAQRLVGDRVAGHDRDFEALLVEALGGAAKGGQRFLGDLPPDVVAGELTLISKGIKHGGVDAAGYAARLRRSVALFCEPPR